MSIINKILHAIEENNIQNFLLTETITGTEELFFVKKERTLTRNKDVTKCEVTIYHDFEKNGVKMRGSSSFTANNAMSEIELNEKTAAAYSSALSVCNPYYKLPAANEIFTENDRLHSEEPQSSRNDYNAQDIADMIYINDTHNDAFVNSLEIFVTTKKLHIINSNGINITYTTKIYSGEFVVQCKEPNDVELYQDFKYSSLDDGIEKSLSKLLSDNLCMVRDRARAVSIHDISAKRIKYDSVILEGNCVYELFQYYLKRLDASMIYPGYSQFKLNEPVIAESEESADKLNISLAPKNPYSNEGVKLIQTALVKDNVAECITGNARFSFYLGIPAIGEYSSYNMKCGNMALDEMCKKPYLKIVNFSDFQMDELSGQFGGEFRLAYYFDGTDTIPVTNGSISGNINDLVKTMRLSKESQQFYDFNGPLAVSYTL